MLKASIDKLDEDIDNILSGSESESSPEDNSIEDSQTDDTYDDTYYEHICGE